MNTPVLHIVYHVLSPPNQYCLGRTQKCGQTSPTVLHDQENVHQFHPELGTSSLVQGRYHICEGE